MQSTTKRTWTARNLSTLEIMGAHAHTDPTVLADTDDAFIQGIVTEQDAGLVEVIYAPCLDGVTARDVDAFSDARDPFGGSRSERFSRMLPLGEVRFYLNPEIPYGWGMV